jgi:hypothetical protein
MAFWIILGTVVIVPWLTKVADRSGRFTITFVIIVAMLIWRAQHPRKK